MILSCTQSRIATARSSQVSSIRIHCERSHQIGRPRNTGSEAETGGLEGKLIDRHLSRIGVLISGKSSASTMFEPESLRCPAGAEKREQTFPNASTYSTTGTMTLGGKGTPRDWTNNSSGWNEAWAGAMDADAAGRSWLPGQAK